MKWNNFVTIFDRPVSRCRCLVLRPIECDCFGGYLGFSRGFIFDLAFRRFNQIDSRIRELSYHQRQNGQRKRFNSTSFWFIENEKKEEENCPTAAVSLCQNASNRNNFLLKQKKWMKIVVYIPTGRIWKSNQDLQMTRNSDKETIFSFNFTAFWLNRVKNVCKFNPFCLSVHRSMYEPANQPASSRLDDVRQKRCCIDAATMTIKTTTRIKSSECF